MIGACKKLSLRKNPALIVLIWLSVLRGGATRGFEKARAGHSRRSDPDK
jgi:hypothetical protein